MKKESTLDELVFHSEEHGTVRIKKLDETAVAIFHADGSSDYGIFAFSLRDIINEGSFGLDGVRCSEAIKNKKQ